MRDEPPLLGIGTIVICGAILVMGVTTIVVGAIVGDGDAIVIGVADGVLVGARVDAGGRVGVAVGVGL